MPCRLALIALLILAGCGGSAPAPPAPPAPPASRTLSFPAADGARLSGRYTPASRKPAPAVVLVHGLYGEPAQWSRFARELNRAGLATLAYASRRDDETDDTVLARDVVGAVRALRARPEVDADRILLAGASVGGAAVVYALGTRSKLHVRGAVAFSPVAVTRAPRLRVHDLLVISDQREAPSAGDLRTQAGGHGVTLFAVEAAGHGSALLDNSTASRRALEWLTRRARTEN